jgi:hypothetical protein
MQHPTAVRFYDAKVGRDVAENFQVTIPRVDQGFQYGSANLLNSPYEARDASTSVQASSMACSHLFTVYVVIFSVEIEQTPFFVHYTVKVCASVRTSVSTLRRLRIFSVGFVAFSLLLSRT